MSDILTIIAAVGWIAACGYGERKDGDAADGLASVAETRFVYCPKCGARMDGGSYAKAD